MKLFVVLGICITLIYGVSCHAKPCKRSANAQGGCIASPRLQISVTHTMVPLECAKSDGSVI